VAYLNDSYSIIDVKSESGGVLITFTQVNGAKRPCNVPEIKARKIPVKGTSIERLLGGLNVCSVNTDEVDCHRTLKNMFF
jgi:hypothetical protein